MVLQVTFLKIIYCPRLAIKTQAIVDFLVEINNDSEGE